MTQRVHLVRWMTAGVLALFVVFVATPSGAKPWALAALALAALALVLCLGANWARARPANGARYLMTGVFTAGLLGSVFYLRSLPTDDASIPLAGVAALVVSLSGLATTGLGMPAHRSDAQGRWSR